jgi:superfamily II DNA or RNA helicase
MASHGKKSWAKLLALSFSTAVQAEGRSLFSQGLVTLLEVQAKRIAARVGGRIDNEASDEVTLELGSQNVKAQCQCLCWHEGVPCPHMWAAILAADGNTHGQNKQRTQKTTPLPLDVPPAPAGDDDPVLPPMPYTPYDQSWYPLLFPQDATVGYSQPAVGASFIAYTLHVDKGQVRVSVAKHRVLKSGKLGKAARVDPAIIYDPEIHWRDRDILSLMLGASLQQEMGYPRSIYGYRSNIFEELRPDVSTLSRLLPELVATRRCSVAVKGEVLVPRLLSGGTSRLKWITDSDAPGRKTSGLVYQARLEIQDQDIDFDQVDTFFSTRPVMFLHGDFLYSLPGVNFEWVTSMRRRKGRLTVPKTQMPELIQTLLEDPAPPNIAVPPSMLPTLRRDVAITPCLELTLRQNAVQTQVWFDYEGKEVLWEDPRSNLLDTESWAVTARDHDREQALLKPVHELGLDTFDEESVPLDKIWAGLDVLATQGWVLRGRDKRRIQAGRVSGLRVSSGVDWFELDGGVDFDGVVVPLPEVVRSYLRGESIIELGNGQTGILPRQWLEQHARMLELGTAGRKKDQTLRFHTAHARLLDELLQECPDQPRDFLELRDRLKSFAGVTPPPPPLGFVGRLRPYQHDALGWFEFLASFGFGGILADDMGLGKTIQALAWMTLLKEKGGGPHLVVGPTSLLFNWRDEAARFAPDLRVLIHAGQGRSGQKKLFQNHDLVLTTYGLLRRDVELLRKTKWTCLVLDESQAIKNPDSQTAKAARLLPAEHRLCLSGTPLENRLDELWSQMQFLNPGLLGSRQSFDARFVKPMAQGDTKACELLQHSIKPFVLRRTKEAVAKDLPDKQETIIRCEMPTAQAGIYERLHAHYRAEILAAVETKGIAQSQIKVLEGLLRLRQAACHPALVGDKDAGSGKLDELLRMVGDVVREGHKALVFSQFTKFLELIRKSFKEAGIEHEYLDGRTPLKSREKRVAAFQSPDGPPVFCISLKAGGVGLNLTAADYVFIMDPWWNPAVEAQAVNRAHRIGQDKNVFAYRLISQGTIDEKVLALQQEKKDLADTLMDGATSSIGALTREDLERLLE